MNTEKMVVNPFRARLDKLEEELELYQERNKDRDLTDKHRKSLRKRFKKMFKKIKKMRKGEELLISEEEYRIVHLDEDPFDDDHTHDNDPEDWWKE